MCVRQIPSVVRNVVVSVWHTILYFLSDSIKWQNNRDIFPATKQESGNRRQGREMLRSWHIGHGEADAGWMFTGQEDHTFKISSLNTEQRKTVNQTQDGQ